MMEIGRVCIKTAGRDSGKIGVVTDLIDKRFVAVAGQTRKKRCNIAHLEPTKHLIKIKKGASNAEIIKELKKLNILKE